MKKGIRVGERGKEEGSAFACDCLTLEEGLKIPVLRLSRRLLTHVEPPGF